ncbi:hypothetical protein L195_g003344, partial [Trifolium pratense]
CLLGSDCHIRFNSVHIRSMTLESSTLQTWRHAYSEHFNFVIFAGFVTFVGIMSLYVLTWVLTIHNKQQSGKGITLPANPKITGAVAANQKPRKLHISTNLEAIRDQRKGRDCRINIQKIITLKIHHPPPRTQEPKPTQATSHINGGAPKAATKQWKRRKATNGKGVKTTPKGEKMVRRMSLIAPPPTKPTSKQEVWI